MIKAVVELCTELVGLAREVVELARVIVEKSCHRGFGEYVPKHLRR